MPHTFTDAADRMWTIPMTVGSIRRVENALGYNLANAAEPAEEGESPLLTRLAIDPALLVDVVYVLVQPQAEKQGVDDLQFGEAIDGDAYGRAVALGAEPVTPARVRATLDHLTRAGEIRWLAAPGAMGATYLAEGGLEPEVVGAVEAETTPA
ncbi:MAG: hypothetical protein ACOC3G_01575, partial [Phycisphaeraceae bacterium]